MSRRYEPPIQCEGYSVNGWFNSVLQHSLADHREFLAARDAFYPYCFRPFSSRISRTELRSEQMGDEGWEE